MAKKPKRVRVSEAAYIAVCNLDRVRVINESIRALIGDEECIPHEEKAQVADLVWKWQQSLERRMRD